MKTSFGSFEFDSSGNLISTNDGSLDWKVSIINQNDPGKYSLEFNPPFNHVPVIVVTNNGNGSDRLATAVNPAKTGAQIQLYSIGSKALINGKVGFVAMAVS